MYVGWVDGEGRGGTLFTRIMGASMLPSMLRVCVCGRRREVGKQMEERVKEGFCV